MQKRTESQSHGFIWENEILTKVYRVNTKNLKYTRPHDLPKQLNKFDKVNVSIKTTGSPTLCMACPIRFYNSLLELKGNEYLHMIIITYRQTSPEIKRIKSIYEVKFNKTHLSQLFGSLTLDDLIEYRNFIKCNTPVVNSTYKDVQQKLNEKSGFIRINPKIGKKSRRIQCSISQFEKKCQFEKIHSDGFFRGVPITTELKSPRRKRNTIKTL